MNKVRLKILIVFFLTSFIFLLFGPISISANHSWNGYHWARTSNPFTLKLGDNLSPNWEPILSTVSSDWSQSPVLDTTIVSGVTSPRRCRPTSGRVEVCNYRYGNNGWLGLAQIWITGSHITQAVVKANDTYFNTTTYNTIAWRNLVLCQEVGHTLGLDHQDEIFDNLPLGTCMDYSNNPEPNQHPNQHDYDELDSIYSHLDSTISLSQSLSDPRAARDLSEAREWGKQVKNNGKIALYERDFGHGSKIITLVILVK